MSATFAGARAGKASRRGVDPAHREGQRRQRQRERPSDVAGAEQIDRARALAERLGPFVGAREPFGQRALARPVAVERALDPSVGPEPRAQRRRRRRLRRPPAPRDRRRRAGRRSRSASRRGRRSIGRARGQARASGARAGPRPLLSAACAASSAAHSSAPPPIVPWKPPDGRTTMRAPASRGLEPSTRASVTSAADAFGFDRFDEAAEGSHR